LGTASWRFPRGEAIIPPDAALVVKWRKAGGKVGTFEVNACFFEQVLHSEGIATSDFVPRRRRVS